MPRVPRKVAWGQQVELAPAPVQSYQATIFNQAFCPVCLVQHSRGHWERMTGAEITALGIVMESRGRGSLQTLEHFGPDEDRDGLYGLVKTNLLRAVAAWVSLGWLTPEEVEAAGGAVQPARDSSPGAPMPATPGPGAPSAPAPVAIPSFALPESPGRAGAQKLIRHLKHLEDLDSESPAVAQELERLGEDVQGWVDQVEEKINDEEAKDDPNDDRVDRLTDQKETLEKVVNALSDDKDIEAAMGDLDDAFPGR